MKFRHEYRVTQFTGYPEYFAVEIRYWWLPILWIQVQRAFEGMERAEEYANEHANYVKPERIVRYLGRLP